MDVPRIHLPAEECLTLAASLSPELNLTDILTKLEQCSAHIASLPVSSAQRQLLAALRRRAGYWSNPSTKDWAEKRELEHWLAMQASCPLSA